MLMWFMLWCQASDSGSPTSSADRPLRLRFLMKSFSTGSRGYEKMHSVKENMKQLLRPWKRKLAEVDGEEVQSNDDFGTHPVYQVELIQACGPSVQHTLACGAAPACVQHVRNAMSPVCYFWITELGISHTWRFAKACRVADCCVNACRRCQE